MKRSGSSDVAEHALAHARFGQAQLAFLDRLRTAPDDDDALLGLGRAFLGAGDAKHAFGCFEKLVARTPGHAIGWRWLGLARHRLGRPRAAEEALDQSLRLAPDDAETAFLLGAVRLADDRPAEAEPAFARACELAPRDARAWLGLGSSRQALGRAAEARAAFDRGLALEPDSLAHRWARTAASPLVYADDVELSEHVSRTELELEELSRFVDDRSRTALAAEGLAAIQDNFRVHYRGRDVTRLQRIHGRVVHRVASATMPSLAAPLPPRSTNARVRVGFVSSSFRSHTVLELFERWMTELDRDRFEVFVYQLGPAVDARTAELARAVEHFHHDSDLLALGGRVRADALDVVVFPELGMDRRVLALGATRLAPVQAVSCGHPVTTGLPTIDFFLSGELVEPPDADAAYVERLVRLPGLGLTPKVPPTVALADGDERRATRSSLGLSNGPLLLSCQSLFKYLPAHDDLLARIAREVPEAQVVFLSHPVEEVTNRFRDRMQSAFARHGVAERLKILPRLPHATYLALNRAADLFLDTLEFSAGRSGLEAIAMGLVPITSPGAFARGRYLSAALCAIGLDELVARDTEEYVERAVQLARDPARRAALSETLRRRAPQIFSGREALHAFERFLLAQSRRAGVRAEFGSRS